MLDPLYAVEWDCSFPFSGRVSWLWVFVFSQQSLMAAHVRVSVYRLMDAIVEMFQGPRAITIILLTDVSLLPMAS